MRLLDDLVSKLLCDLGYEHENELIRREVHKHFIVFVEIFDRPAGVIERFEDSVLDLGHESFLSDRGQGLIIGRVFCAGPKRI